MQERPEKFEGQWQELLHTKADNACKKLLSWSIFTLIITVNRI